MDRLEYEHNRLHCRACGHPLSVASNIGPERTPPRNGDVSVCVGCGELSFFVVGPFGVYLREPSVEELAALPPDKVRASQGFRIAWRKEGRG